MELHRIYELYSSWIDFVIYFSIFGSAIRIALWNVFDDKRAVKLLIVGGGALLALSLTLWSRKHDLRLLDFGPFGLVFLIIFIIFIVFKFVRKTR